MRGVTHKLGYGILGEKNWDMGDWKVGKGILVVKKWDMGNWG